MKKKNNREGLVPGSGPKQEPEINSAVLNFPIVGIGASAGGLAAFEAFFSGMPVDSDPGMAFVLVQHLAPDHKSILTDLIRRYTRMRVFEVEDGITVQPNCAYIIPPKHDMAFLNGKLQLLEPTAPRGQRLTIDFFFNSLAKDQKERAIGIILSGTGSDGTQGIRAIKAENGMVMAQNQDSTEYDGMPRNAIATGLVDYELLPADMPAQLIAYVSHAFGKLEIPTSPQTPNAENALRKIFILLRAQTSHDFSMYKPSTVYRRIERRLAVNQIETLDDYVRYLQKMPSEVEALFRDLLIGVTGFFRDPEAFKVLEQQVIPKLFSDRKANMPIRIWVPGCSTGEEAYSIAILLAEWQENNKQRFKIQVFATDIDNQAISSARNGHFPASIADNVSQERLDHFFVAEPGGSFRIQKTIRDMLIFSEQDIIKDPPFSKLDLISCRNLLIYMGGDLQKKIIPLFHYALNPSGFLFLGTSETVGAFTTIYSVVNRKYKLYQRKNIFLNNQHGGLNNIMIPMLGIDTKKPFSKNEVDLTITKPNTIPLRELTEQALLRHAVPAAVLVTAQGDILYLHGRTGMYLEPAQGESRVNNILKMAREGLRHKLTTALHNAAKKKDVVSCPGLQVKTNGDYSTVNLTILPITIPKKLSSLQINRTIQSHSPDRLYLVILDAKKTSEHDAKLQVSNNETSISIESGIEPEENALITALREELDAKEEYLQSSNEELETANEELISTNEEIQSVNEELQSTNEELETSKEELQSVNEELSTVNSELQTMVADLSQANNDMNNLLAGTGIATIFVDHKLRIIRFTPTATRIINLILSDIGRPVNHILSNLVDYDQLESDIQSVLENLIPKEIEVQTGEGLWYTMRILPYRTLENIIMGAVLTFVDISDRKTIELQKKTVLESLQDTQTCLKMALTSSGAGTWEWNLITNENKWSDELWHLFGMSPQCCKPTNDAWIASIHPGDQARVRSAIKVASDTGNDLRIEWRVNLPDGSDRHLLLHGQAKRDSADAIIQYLGIISDITDRPIKRDDQ
jgi:two-component system, chemotaxis family, CheB/CheR fusion protein